MADPTGSDGSTGNGEDDAKKKPPVVGPHGAEWPDPPKHPARSRLRSAPVPGPRTATRKDRFPWRFILYGLVVAYLAGDFFLFRGPLKRRVESRRALSVTPAETAIKNDWVATVNGRPVTNTRLRRAVDAHLYQRGKTRDDISAVNLRYVRGAVLQGLLNDTLVEQFAIGQKHQISDTEAEAAIERFESQFSSADMLDRRSAAQHLDLASRRERLRQLATQTAWLEAHLARSTPISDDLAQQWFEENRSGGAESGFALPERIRARHIFLSTVNEGQDSPEREQLIRDLHRQLNEEEADFATIAAEHSEDLRTRTRGGDLNWFSSSRMPEDFYQAVSSLTAGQLSPPFRTSLGWHIAEVIERRPARDVQFEEVREEIIAYLETEDRRQKIDEFLGDLRRASTIQVFPEQL